MPAAQAKRSKPFASDRSYARDLQAVARCSRHSAVFKTSRSGLASFSPSPCGFLFQSFRASASATLSLAGMILGGKSVQSVNGLHMLRSALSYQTCPEFAEVTNIGGKGIYNPASNVLHYCSCTKFALAGILTFVFQELVF